jgi:transposase
MMTVEQHDQIRQMYYQQNLSGRHIAKRLGISRNTVAKALTEESAPRYKLKAPRPAPKLAKFKARIDQLLAENQRLPKKQRLTNYKIYQVISAEGFTGSASSVNTYAVEWRKRQRTPKVFLPLEFAPGQDGQVDWGEAEVFIAGIRQTVQIFVMWLAYSRRIFVMAFPGQKQEAFFEGHVKAFQFFGGVPHRLSYDNLKTAVKQLTEGRIREENRAFIAFRSYYLFASHFCTPGQGHEKGGVEASVGFSRRNFLVPIPHVASFAELNHYLLEQCRANDARIVHGQSRTIGEMWVEERVSLRPLPLRPFDCCITRTATLTGYSQLIFETNRYSVPVELARRELTIKAYPFEVQILNDQQVIATHPRSYQREQDIYDPLHYLALLEQRPGAFDYAKPLKRWRAEWPPTYHQLLQALKLKHDESHAIREFVKILGLHKEYARPLVERAVKQALSYGCAHFEGVRQCLHQLARPEQLELPLLDLTHRPELARVAQQPPDTRCYEQLLERPG